MTIAKGSSELQILVLIDVRYKLSYVNFVIGNTLQQEWSIGLHEIWYGVTQYKCYIKYVMEIIGLTYN